MLAVRLYSEHRRAKRPRQDPTRSRFIALPSAAAAEEDNLQCINQHQEVEEQAVIFDVVQVVLQLLQRILGRGTVAVAHLRPAGDAWLDAVAYIVVRDHFDQLLDKIGALGTRTDEG